MLAEPARGRLELLGIGTSAQHGDLSLGETVLIVDGDARPGAATPPGSQVSLWMITM